MFSVRCPGAQVPSRATKHFESKRSFKNSKKKKKVYFSTVWFMIFNSNLLVLKGFCFGYIFQSTLWFQHQSNMTAGHSDVPRPCD